ncbi:NAD(P)/FAD-dependent oxidoreductase [Candidatus Coxiella mudrowiae]|uniref:NAD(P)/FAD-dependent oxidoreductase n=1 Tax=Candidatus Coxiella mudrowiae TaxID=2054173 RepID=UPI000C2829BA|nr:FAD-dependent oxidoreductase [Candidatus Coxiella mudrowiae]
MKKQPVVIIGSGLAGYLFAKEFRKLDTTTPLEIITANDGAFYSKPLLSTALTNKKLVAQLAVYSANEMSSQLQARIHTHMLVEAIDPSSQVIQIRREKITYQKLIMACGSKTVTPTLQGDGLSAVTAINDLDAYERFRAWIEDKKSLVILGAGLVGCEFANDLINVGYHVEVISPDPYPLSKLVPERVGVALQKSLADKGVNWHLNKAAKVVSSDGNDYRIALEDENTIHADGVLSAIGIRPQCDLAETLNLKRNWGIVVDRYLKTSIENIYALGDCAEVAGEVRQYVAPLLQCARALARHLMGDKHPVQYPPMPIIIKTPACALATYPPPETIEGEWQYWGEGKHQKALFYNREGKLLGFALSGDCVKERMLLTQQLPAVF